MLGATPVYLCTCAASSAFSYGVRGTRLREHLEPGSAVPERPRRQLDPMVLERVFDGRQVTHFRLIS
jgi:hypothetical protein